MNKGAEHINFEVRDVYERMIDVFFYFKPIKDLKKTVHPEFMGYGTAAHEFFSNRLDVTAMAESQSEQLRHQKVEIQRKPIVERVFANGTSCLIIEEFDMNFKDTNHHLLARLSTILECIDGKWIVTHFHGSTPDSDIAEDEAFPKEGLRKKNEELEAKIKARTRDLEIEAALEKVRSRSIGMQKSEELREVIQVIHDQLILLNFQIDAAGFTLDYHQNNDWNVWIANKSGSLPSLMFIPYIDHPQFNYYKHAKEEGLDFLANTLNFEDKNSIFNYMFRFMGDYPQAEKDELLSKPGLAISQAFLKNISLWAYNLDAIPYSEEENKTLMRFAKVFEQTYVRFNDLQKAETQAREAQIEAALERVRSRSLAMHKSEELNEVVSVIFEKLKELQIPATAVGIGIYIDGSKDLNSFVCGENKEGLVITNYRLPYFNNKISKDLCNANEEQMDFFVGHYSKQVKNNFYQYILDHTPEFKQLPKDIKQMIFNSPSYTITMVVAKHAVFNINDFEGKTLSDKDIAIIKRVARVFDQTYTRFRDLQKAEAQAREAQINLGVERVRAKALAMHKSEEIIEVVAKLKDEVMSLDIPDVIAATIFLKEGEDTIRMWDLSSLQKLDGVYQSPLDITFKLKKTDPHLYPKRVWENPDNYFVEIQDTKGFKRILAWLREHGKHEVANETEAFIESTQLKQLYHVAKKLNSGKLVIDLLNPPSDEMETILTKMGAAFDLAYKRFEDLQKAEAQAREAQIEVALERVRSKTMAMHTTNELTEVLGVLFDQFDFLGIKPVFTHLTLFDEENETFTLRIATGGKDRTIAEQRIDVNAVESWKQSFANWKNSELHAIDCIDYQPEDLPFIWEVLDEVFSALPEGQKLSPSDFPEGLYTTQGHCKYGFIGLNQTRRATEEEREIVIRFAKEFGRLYQRFLDIQKAEEQAREAQIEGALERVRSKTMAMHNSEDLEGIVISLFEEVMKLGLDKSMRCGIGILEDHEGMETRSVNSKSDGTVELRVGMLDMTIHPMLVGLKKAWKNGKTAYSYYYTQEDVRKYYETLNNEPEYPFNADLETLPKQEFHQSFFFSSGILFSFSENPISEESSKVLTRFAAVFGQTYRRFLDLQKAEAQARESMVELSLERIRAQVTAMRESSELLDIVVTMRSEFTKLGHEANYFWYMRWLPEIYEKAMTSLDGTRIGTVMKLPRSIHGNIKMLAEWEKSDKPTVVYAMDAEAAVDYVDTMIGEGDFQQIDPQAPSHDDIRHIGGLTFVMARTTHGEIGYSLPGVVPELPEEDLATLVRFAGVFDLANKRFEDLKNSESQRREVQIELALERVRARTMGMQKSKELGDVATVLFKELNQLVDNLWTCGFVLCEKDRAEDEWWLSDENGFIPAFYLPNVGDEAHANIYNAWKSGADYHTEQLEGDALQKHYEWLMNIPVAKKIFDDMIATGFELPTWQKLHCAYFKTGYLVIITQVPCPEDEIFKRFAQVFDLTYTRFLDLQLKEEQAIKLVEDKQQLEKTLSDLQATQSQLIQSEKMASLGELTAGIAHEIQNPLNFVNNFSEVSKELLEEMMEEMQKGDLEEVNALAEDIIQNLEKINHHGQRADGIVKGMLQHSRTSSGKKEPTDINVLADEYLRLAYHGLRAKDKTFNASLETHFDESIGKVNVLAQDLGRVILNLITNAFYVVKEKKEQQPQGYEPTVTVTTKKEGKNVQIAVRDNGNGIPEAIREKIFQPFFTTKPTGQGTGLGLSMSYDIVTKGHGGELKVETKEGEGTTFLITIPFETKSN